MRHAGEVQGNMSGDERNPTGLSAEETEAIKRRAWATADAIPLRDESVFSAAVEEQLARLNIRASQIGKARATVLALAEVGITKISQDKVFQQKDVVSRRVFYDKAKGWYHDPLFREVLETVRRLYHNWSAGATAREATAEFVENQARLREMEWQASRKLSELAAEMLSTPLYDVETVTEKDGGTTIERTVLKAARWTFADVWRLYESASKLGRASLGMTNGGRQEVDVNLRDALPEGVTPEQAQQVEMMLARMLADAADAAQDEDDDDD
jgi:hypothetical protein